MPNTPNAMRTRAREVFELYFAMELEILRDITARLSDGIDDPRWAVNKRKQRKAFRDSVKSKMDGLNDETRDFVFALYAASYLMGSDGFRDEYKALFDKDLPATTTSPEMRDMRAQFKQDFKAISDRVIRSADSHYTTTVAAVVRDTMGGAKPRTEALQDALDDVARKGISGKTDKADRRWGMGEYAEMLVGVGLRDAALLGYTEMAEEHEQDLLLVDFHPHPCPLCVPWERKVLSLTGKMRNHPACSATLREAVDQGLFHVACWHVLSIYVPGVTEVPKATALQPRLNKLGYMNRQRMRSSERKVRLWKRLQTVAFTPENERRAKAYVDRWQERITELSDATGIQRARGRTGERVVLSDEAREMKPFKIGG